MSNQLDMAIRAAHGDFSPEVTAWLQEGLRRHIGGDGKLDECLGLDRRSMCRARNSALDEAARALGGGCTTWVLACKLSEAIAYFENRVWLRARVGLGFEATPLNCALARLFFSGVSFPRTARKLYDWLILTDGIGKTCQ